jgi:hypothetical protein
VNLNSKKELPRFCSEERREEGEWRNKGVLAFGSKVGTLPPPERELVF